MYYRQIKEPQIETKAQTTEFRVKVEKWGKMCVCVKCTSGKWVKGGRHFATTSAESQMKGKGNGR